MGIADRKFRSRLAPPPPEERDHPELRAIARAQVALDNLHAAYQRRDRQALEEAAVELTTTLPDTLATLGVETTPADELDSTLLDDAINAADDLVAELVRANAEIDHLEAQRSELLPWARYGAETMPHGAGPQLLDRINAGEFGEVWS